MKIFGRKANRQSQIPLPPELREYYRPTPGAHFRRTMLLILPVLAVAIVASVLIAGVWWWTHHNSATPNKSSLQISKNTPTTVNGSTNTSHLPTYLQANPSPSKPQPKPAPSPSSKPTPESQPQSAPAPALVNTGPNMVTVLVPLSTALLAATLFEAYQAVAARR